MQRLTHAMEEALPDADVIATVGRKTSFEVSVDGRYSAHSKLATAKFPAVKELAEEVKAYAASGRVPASWKELPEAERKRVEVEMAKG
jgi:hypothetical protein